jgi:hypothetical protein
MRNLFLLIFLILFTNTLFGQNSSHIVDDFGGEIFPISFEFKLSEDFQLNYEFSIGLFNYYYVNSKTGFGYDSRFIMPKYYYNFQNHIISFFGINIFWNVFKLIDSKRNLIDESIFGPCLSLDYLNWNLSEPFDTIFYNYNFKIGIRYSRLFILNERSNARNFAPIFNLEAGYKNTNGINNVYLSIQTSFPYFLVKNYK